MRRVIEVLYKLRWKMFDERNREVRGKEAINRGLREDGRY